MSNDSKLMYESQSDCVLTVGIPTFERAELWPTLIENLELLFSKCPFAIEVIVFDNHSGDQTWEIISKWRNESKFKESIFVNRQETNVGASKNIVDTMRHCRGYLYSFIGDDDRYEVDEFVRVISILRLNTDLQAAIHVPELRQMKIVDTLEAMEYLYQYGNAWMGIIRSDVLRGSLANQELVDRALQTIWPQTMLGLSQLQVNSASSVLLFPEVIGRRTSKKTWAELTRPSAGYYIKSYEGLLDATISIHNKELRKVAIISIAGQKSLVRKAHQRSMAKDKRSRDFGSDSLRLKTKLSALKVSETRRARVVFTWIRFPRVGRLSYTMAINFANLLFPVIARILRRYERQCP